jgi:hypothetical protein
VDLVQNPSLSFSINTYWRFAPKVMAYQTSQVKITGRTDRFGEALAFTSVFIILVNAPELIDQFGPMFIQQEMNAK